MKLVRLARTSAADHTHTKTVGTKICWHSGAGTIVQGSATRIGEARLHPLKRAWLAGTFTKMDFLYFPYQGGFPFYRNLYVIYAKLFIKDITWLESSRRLRNRKFTLFTNHGALPGHGRYRVIQDWRHTCRKATHLFFGTACYPNQMLSIGKYR